MIGAITGDVLGSVYEGARIKRKDFRLFNALNRPTDDSVLTLAVADAILRIDDASAAGELSRPMPTEADFAERLRKTGRRYPRAGYGGSFHRWMENSTMGPYQSWGNGSAMRASAVGWAYESVEDVLRVAELSARPTHDHREGIKGAQAVALAVFLARHDVSREDLRFEISRRFGYDLDRTVDEIRPGYAFEISCQRSVPESIIAFLDSTDFEDTIRNAISLGGDADTQACIAGAVAEAFYGGVPESLLAWVLPRLDSWQLRIARDFAGRFMTATRVAQSIDRLVGDGAMLEEPAAADNDPDGGDQPPRGIDLARGFFHEIVEPLLSELVPGLRYSAALIGPGSEVLGYDDETSTDHHWGPRVQIFCDEADAVSHRPRLTRELADRLPRRHAGFPTNFSSPDPEDHGVQLLVATDEGPVNHRVEILGLETWLGDYLGIGAGARATADAAGVACDLDALDWLTVPQQKLLSIASGAVFRDDDARLATLRSALGWYPDDVWRYLLASVWQRIGQEEHLVGRAGQSGDETGARVIAARLVRDAMRLCLLAARRYAPYAKWLGRAFGELEVATVLGPLLDAVLDAPDWQRRDAALVPVWEELARLHNSLGVTSPLPTHASRFFGRPFHVIAIHGFAEALLSSITSDWLSPALRRSPIGGIDLFTDSTDLLEDPVFRDGLRAMLASRYS